MKLDFSEVSELESKQASEGIHELMIKNAQEKVSKNGTPMLVVDFNDEEGGFTRDNLCLAGPGAFKTKSFLAALGITEEDAANMVASEFVGLNVTAEIVTEDYEEKSFSKVKKYIV